MDLNSLVKSAVLVGMLGFATGCGQSSNSAEVPAAKSADPVKKTTPTAQIDPAPVKPAEPTWPEGDATQAFQRLVQAYNGQEGADYNEENSKLQSLGKDSIPTYIYAITHGDETDRRLACMQLAGLGPDAAPATAELTTLLDDKDEFIRANAASVLSIVPEPPASLVPTLVTLMGNENSDWAQMAILALGNLGPGAESAIDPMIQLLPKASPELQKALLDSLGRIGAPAQAALETIGTLASSDDADIKTAAETARSEIKVAVRAAEMESQESAGAGDDVPETADGDPPSNPDSPALILDPGAGSDPVPDEKESADKKTDESTENKSDEESSTETSEEKESDDSN